jgi:hypothetical protein
MITCQRCGATLDASATACPYCHTQTQYGRELGAHQAAYQYHAAQAEQARREAEHRAHQEAVKKKSGQALIWSIVGLVTCCSPLAIVGLVMGLNVKSAAKKVAVLPPGSSTAAVVLGVCSLLIFSLGVTMYVIDSREKDARVETLKSRIEGRLSGSDIDQQSACALVEIQLLEDGYADKSGISIDGFQCDGKLELEGETATLRDVRFRTSSTERYAVAACLVRGNRWSLKELRADGRCREPLAAPSASASGASSATPSGR